MFIITISFDYHTTVKYVLKYEVPKKLYCILKSTIYAYFRAFYVLKDKHYQN